MDKRKSTDTHESSYQRLQKALGERIKKTDPGGKLPPEPELARQLGVSRSTLREAMRSFEAQGLLLRHQGKGTFVMDTSGVFETGLEVLESLETIADRLGLVVSMDGLTVTEISATKKFKELFSLDGNLRLINISRVIRTDQRPVAFLQDILPSEIIHDEALQEQGFSGSVLDVLNKRGDLVLDRSSTEIQAVSAPQSVARALQIQRGDVLLFIEADLFTKDGRIIDHSYSYFLPGYFRFRVNRTIGVK